MCGRLRSSSLGRVHVRRPSSSSTAGSRIIRTTIALSQLVGHVGFRHGAADHERNALNVELAMGFRTFVHTLVARSRPTATSVDRRARTSARAESTMACRPADPRRPRPEHALDSSPVRQSALQDSCMACRFSGGADLEAIDHCCVRGNVRSLLVRPERGSRRSAQDRVGLGRRNRVRDARARGTRGPL
jgi:hypothetical protein